MLHNHLRNFTSHKSSIYYALHAVFQSVLKDDRGAKYFKPEDEQHLININKIEDVKNNAYHPFIRITFNNNDIWRLDHGGLISENGGSDDTIKLLNRGSAFINHSYISRFHAARNSEDINLWNVFYKDILPFYRADEKTDFLSVIFDNIRHDAKSSPRINNRTFLGKIADFNNKLSHFIEDINKRINGIYNNHFKFEEDNELYIELLYYADDAIENANKESYYLFYGKNRFKQERSELLDIPKIGISIKENGKEIYKPQTYFNEARLTAIALAVRFASLSKKSDGCFLALDDMLISLDMSNRRKVIDYLFGVASKHYNIYLFTHDRAFFELTKEVIVAKNLKSNWTFKELYNGDLAQDNPKCFASEDSFTRAIYHFKNFDYPASANYLRKAVEELILLFPSYISKNDNGSDKDKLRAKIDAAKNVLECTDGNTDDIQHIIFSLGTLLNPLSHRSIDANIYRIELQDVIGIIPRLRQHIINLEIKEVLAIENAITLYIDETENKRCEIKVTLKTPLYSYLNQRGKRVLSIAKGDTVESVTIENEIRGEAKPYKYKKGVSLENICREIHEHLGKDYENNYANLYKNIDGVELINLI